MSSQGSTDNNPPKWFEDWRIKDENRSKERETWSIGSGVFATGLSCLAIGLTLNSKSEGDSTMVVALLAAGLFATGTGLMMMLLSPWAHSLRRRNQ